jgi:UDP-GlcNAc:undecaprenyl-phosphate/decaprenyl-phosphate GlcNAc-1-phosphate transferase
MIPAALLSRPAFLVPLGAALVLGVADDRLSLPPVARLVGQVVVGLVLAALVDVRIATAAGTVLVVVTTVVMMNGVNLIDGLDGLAGGVVAVAGGAFAILVAGAYRDLAVALALGLVGFLVYNRPPARVYLGDGGSYLLGAALVTLLAGAWAPGRSLPTSLAALLLVALPAAEVLFAVVRRARAGRSLTSGDRRHPYDLLVSRGWSRSAASLAYVGAEVVLASAALLLSHTSTAAAAIGVGVGASALVIAAGAVGGLTPEAAEPA